jgi:hypothetical protein
LFFTPAKKQTQELRAPPMAEKKRNFCAMNLLCKSVRQATTPEVCPSSRLARNTSYSHSYSYSSSKPDSSLCSLCELRAFVVKGSSPQNSSKKPVNPRKFTFQHSANIARLGIRLAKFNELENVDSAHPFSSFPCVQGSVGFGSSHQKFQKKPVFALIRGLFPSPLGQNVDLLSFEPRVRTPRESAIIGKYRLSFFLPARRMYLQKINFSVSAELKQPPLQMNELPQFSTETNEKH